MLLGKISGRVTTKEFVFEAEAKVKKLDYVAVKTPEGEWVTAYIDNIIRYADRTKAEARVIGYRNPRGFLIAPNVPFAPQTPVFSASEEQIKNTLGLPEEGLYIGKLEGYNINVNLPVKQLVTKHVSILAKTGAGKSYMAGVLLEELAEKNIPVVVIDPHGEYSSLVKENDEEKELRYAEKFGVEPKSYRSQVQVFSPENNRLKLDGKLSAEELFQCLPIKVSSTQKGLIYSAMRNLGNKDYTVADLMNEVSNIPSQSKWNLISGLDFLQKTNLFSANPTAPQDFVKDGVISILDLKFARPEIQHMIVYKVVEELFAARKRGQIPGFFLVLEEAHTFCPERGFGEVASSKMIRTIASEGRKFGLSLCIISQRPARVDKNVLSQCNTQVIMKVTNPNDLKAISDSAEGITQGVKEGIRDLPIGNALVIGVTEQPVLAEIRIRRSKHGGEAIQVLPEPVQVSVTNLALPMRFTLDDIRHEFKGSESILQIHYPLWFVEGTVNGDRAGIYVDGLLGEIVYESDGEIRRTRGIRSLVTLSSMERRIIALLGKVKQTTLEKVSAATRLLPNDAHRILKILMAKGLVSSDGYMYRPSRISIPHNLLKTGISAAPEETGLQGKIVNFNVSKDMVTKIAELFGIWAESTKIVYCPYWLLVYKNRKVLVDGMSKRMDVEATREVMGMIG
ncbi:MAG: ATP-binding protein [Candidatus Aenigmarchaeota archaeon]|nr:ATP-binding protein [Candidatus Aenigmarchaeota archaeon]